MRTRRQGEPAAICGHRGAAAVEAENTLASFAVAVDRGATWVEFDVRPTQDLELVVHHDPDTASGQHIASCVRTELDASIPVFGELVAALPGVGLDFEIKTDATGTSIDDLADLVVAEIERHLGSGYGRLLVTSFDTAMLEAVRRRSPAIPTGLLFHDRAGSWAIETALDVGHVAIVPWYPLVTPELVNDAHDCGLAVATWTVNDPAEARRVDQAGVDMIIGDDPALLLDALAR